MRHLPGSSSVLPGALAFTACLSGVASAQTSAQTSGQNSAPAPAELPPAAEPTPAAPVASTPAEAAPAAAAPPVETAPVEIAPAPAEEQTTKLKDVIVTAQRREETAQSVPSALSVLSGDKLTEASIGRTAKEVLDYVPNASANTQLHGRPRWWIRGVGSGQQQLDFSNPVGFYVDDVYISNASATGFPIFDLDRVEVLRGPQGTLWGKNTTGGAINIVSRKPSFSSDGYLRFDDGTYNDRIVEGAAGGAVWKDKLAARASFHYENRGGRFRNLTTGNRDASFADGAFRLQLLAKPTTDVDVLANVHLRSYSVQGASQTVTGTGDNGAYLAGYVPSTDINTVSTNATDSDAIFQNGANLTIKARFSGLTLTAITGYEDFRNTTFNDADYTPLELSRGWAWAKSYQLSQEARLSFVGDRLSWVAGLFGFYEDIKRESTTAKLPGVDTVAPGPSNFAYTAFDHATKSFAAFASATYRLHEIFQIGAGLRFTNETRSLDFSRVGVANGTPAAFSNIGRWWLPSSVSTPLTAGFEAHPENTWNNLTGDLTPQLTLNKNALLYVRYAHGVKSGGYNTAATSAAALNVVQPEKLDNYELGAKTTWWGGRLTANASAFRYEYRDIQVNVVGPLPPTNTAVSYLQNVAKGRVNGGELEVDALPLRQLHLAGSLGLLDTKFTDFQVLNGGANYTGNQFVRSPHVSSLLRGEYVLPVTSEGAHVTVGADWRYTSRQYHFATTQNDRLLTTGRLHIVNARISLADRDDKVILSVYANNLGDAHYRAHSLPASANATGAVTIYGDPRTVGASLLVRWW